MRWKSGKSNAALIGGIIMEKELASVADRRVVSMDLIVDKNIFLS